MNFNSNFKMDGVLNFLLNEEFWLPRGYSWKDLTTSDPDVYYPRVRDLTLPSLLLAAVLFLLRHLFDRFVIFPLCSYLNISSRRHHHIEHNPIFETFFQRSRCPDENAIVELQKKTNFSKIYIRSWFRRRRLKDCPPMRIKISENSWNFIFYFGAFLYGLKTLWNKPWFSETKNCWKDWPHQHVSNDVYIFYLIELSFYWSMSFTLLVEKKKKDFIIMIVHHTATIVLIYFSWVCNFVRIGTLIILVHDAVDYWMSAAKLAKYAKKQNLCELLFVIFVIVWFITRLWIYPFRLLYSLTYEIHDHVEPFQSHTLFKTMAYILQMLHIVWTYMILRIALQKLFTGHINHDVRSDTESEDESFIEDHVINGNVVAHDHCNKVLKNGHSKLQHSTSS